MKERCCSVWWVNLHLDVIKLSHWAGNNNFRSFSARYCSADNKEQVWIFPEQLSAQLRRTRAKIYEIKWMHFLEHINTPSSFVRGPQISRAVESSRTRFNKLLRYRQSSHWKSSAWEFSSKVQSTRRREPRNFAAQLCSPSNRKNDYN